MKGITPIIAIIVLLLITVALAGVAWSYLQTYMTGLTSKSIEVRDYFCITVGAAPTNQVPVIVVANIGTDPITTAEITIINSASGTSAAGFWYPMSGGTTPIQSIAVNSVGRWQGPATTAGTTSSFRISTAGGRTQRVSITC